MHKQMLINYIGYTYLDHRIVYSVLRYPYDFINIFICQFHKNTSFKIFFSIIAPFLFNSLFNNILFENIENITTMIYSNFLTFKNLNFYKSKNQTKEPIVSLHNKFWL